VGQPVAQVLSTQAWETLRRSHADYKSSTSTAYDEVLNEVADRILATGSIGKADIGALLFCPSRYQGGGVCGN
jgi:hypothetical protein